MDEIESVERAIRCRDERLQHLKNYASVLKGLAAGPVYPADFAISRRFGFISVTADTRSLGLEDDWIRSVAHLTEADPFVTELIVEAVVASHLVALNEFVASLDRAALDQMCQVRGVFEMVWRQGWDGHRLSVEFPVRHLRNILEEERRASP
jgi:hypothetical protein